MLCYSTSNSLISVTSYRLTIRPKGSPSNPCVAPNAAQVSICSIGSLAHQIRPPKSYFLLSQNAILNALVLYCIIQFSSAIAPLITSLILHALSWRWSTWARTRPISPCPNSLNWIGGMWMLALHIGSRTRTRRVNVHPRHLPFGNPNLRLVCIPEILREAADRTCY